MKGYDESLLETRQVIEKIVAGWCSTLNAWSRLRDAIQSIIACETHEDLPQRLGADLMRVMFHEIYQLQRAPRQPRCIETLAEFSTPDNHQRIDEAFFAKGSMVNLWKSHVSSWIGSFRTISFNGGECKQLDWLLLSCFGESASSWTKWAGWGPSDSQAATRCRPEQRLAIIQFQWD